jgi:hypothetical protein
MRVEGRAKLLKAIGENSPDATLLPLNAALPNEHSRRYFRQSPCGTTASAHRP